MTKIKRKKHRSLFEYEDRMEELSKKNCHLERLNSIIDWELFRDILNKSFEKKSKGPGGAPHYDYVLMFKALVIQKFHQLSDEQTEYQIKDRLSFQKFLGFDLTDDVPDQNTIREFRESLIKNGVIDKIFDRFHLFLKDKGVISTEGVIVDASFVEVPRQRNTRDENKDIKEGKTPEGWEDNPDKMSQKDVDAKWTKKNNKTFFGYKNHIKADKKSKIILSHHTTSANIHDSQPIDDLLDESDKGKDIWADSAYTGQEIYETFDEYEMKQHINEKGYRNRPLTDEQKNLNREKSKTRARVEHIFGFMENSMKGGFIRSIGIKRAQGNIGLINLVYNFCRYWQIVRYGLA